MSEVVEDVELAAQGLLVVARRRGAGCLALGLPGAEGGVAVAFAQHAFDHLRGQQHAGGVVAAEALGVDEAHFQARDRTITSLQAQVLAMHIVGDPVDGFQAR